MIFSCLLKRFRYAFLGFTLGVVLTFLMLNVRAGETIIDSLRFHYILNPGVSVLPDATGSYSVSQVSSLEFAPLFRKSISLTDGAKVHWVKLSINNKLLEHIDWHLLLTPMLNNEVYLVTDSIQVLIARNGNYVKASKSCFPVNPKVITLKLLPHISTSLLIRMDTSIPQEIKPFVNAELRLEKPEMIRYKHSWIVLAVLVGILISLAFYILLQYFLFRDKSFLFFFLSFFCLAMYFLTFDRVGYSLFNTDHITRFTGNYLALLSTFFYISFTRYFLDPNIKYPSWHKILTRLQFLYIIPLTLVVLINLRVFWNFTPFVHSIHVIAFVFLLTFAFKTYRKGGEQAGHYLLANIVFFLFMSLFVYFVQQKPSEGYSSLFLESSLKIGSLGQVLLFTLALANRFSRLSSQVVEKQLENERLEKDKILEIQRVITKANLELEGKVKMRTFEINQQKEELQTQAEHLEKAYHEISTQKKLIEKAHTQITDSIFYAAIIQQAALPKPSLMRMCFKDHFTLYMPRDIVSGDFYWTTQMENITLFAVADCTGHGVPGAFMSMLGISLINEIVKREGLTQPDQILNLLRVHLINALQQESMGSDVRDGMDISICALHRDNSQGTEGPYKLEFAGAHNPLVIVTDNNNMASMDEFMDDIEVIDKNDRNFLYQLRADLMPISMHFRIEPFSLKTINVFRNDMIYLYSDGIIDQIGGPDYKKFSASRLKKVILEVSQHEAETQRHEIEKHVIEWMNHPDPMTGSPCDQIDDICLLGVRVF